MSNKMMRIKERKICVALDSSAELQFKNFKLCLKCLKNTFSIAFITGRSTVWGWSQTNLQYYKTCFDQAHEQDEDLGKEVRLPVGLL